MGGVFFVVWFWIWFSIIYKLKTFSRYWRLSTKLLILGHSVLYLAVLELLKGMLICTRKNLLKYVLASNREFISTTASISIIWVRALYKMPASCLFAAWYFQLFILSVTLIVKMLDSFPRSGQIYLEEEGKNMKTALQHIP